MGGIFNVQPIHVCDLQMRFSMRLIRPTQHDIKYIGMALLR